MMTIYKGQRIFQRNEEGEELRGQIVVSADGQPLDPRLDLLNKSPNGFEWGYHGSGPSQLAFAILMHEFEIEAFAIMMFQEFKRACIAPLKRDYWTMTTREIQKFMRGVLGVKVVVPVEPYDVTDTCNEHRATYIVEQVDESEVNHHDFFIVYILAEAALVEELRARGYAVEVLLSQKRGSHDE